MHDVWTRLTTDIKLAVISTVGVCALIGITPFLIYRVSQGDWLIVAVDLALLLATLFSVWISWRHGSSRLAGQLLATLYSIGCIIVAFKLQPYGLYWFFCLIMFNFFVLPPVQSSIATLTTLTLLCGYGVIQPDTIFSSQQHLITFGATSLISSFFAFVFAWRTDQQRIRLQELASMDPLTGVANRRSLDKEIALAVATHQRHGHAYGLLVMDLDNFKMINDSYGHAEGDRVLVGFADLIRKASRRTDRLFRLGGEEFVLLMMSTDHAGLVRTANNMLHVVSENVRSRDEPVTVSIGGAMLSKGDDADGWLHKADSCMYIAKQQGRNQSVIHP